ncbi:MAG: NAD(P)-binding protein, partial [archaeon]|nr:NAD(P)-binding protein [archaeon]
MNKTVNILGAGISGLSCAIILAKNGCKVNVYESQKTVGTRFNNDWQGIENWSEDIDVLEQIRSFGIKTDFCHEPLNHINFHVGKEENCVDLKDSRAAAYLVRRGKTEESLDNCLLEQAKSLGACVFFGTGKDYLKKDDITIDIN